MTSQQTSSKDKLQALRAQMVACGVDAFLIPRADEYQGEFVAPYAARLKWLTGFAGSAGVAIIAAKIAAVLTDSRYLIQVQDQIDDALYSAVDITKTPAADWLAENLEAGQVIGFDPWLHTPKQIDDLEDKGLTLKSVPNLVDEIWRDQPPRPCAQVEIFPERVAGTSSADKCAQLAAGLRAEKLDHFIFTLPDSICWLLNIRGDDVGCSPLALSYAALDCNGTVRWFIAPDKVSAGVKGALGDMVEIIAPEDMESHLVRLSQQAVGLDFKHSPLWFKEALERGGAKVADLKDPSIAPKALKAPAEQAAIERAHIQDGAALVNFLHWLDTHDDHGALTELDIVQKLEACRRDGVPYRGNSFPTISGYGANGAIVHYRASEETNIALQPPGFLLLDSGGQYGAGDVWGTTDITRTMVIGEVSPEMKRHFTLVLKGHIALASARFKAGTLGKEIDALARGFLQAEGLDYAHGTGHGVGCYLAVHEEAASISPKGEVALEAGMLISNEPGYYQEGSHGIRTENLVLVCAADDGMLFFETVSFAPIDVSAIDMSLLDAAERAWLNVYHEQVREKLHALLSEECAAWLTEKTRTI